MQSVERPKPVFFEIEVRTPSTSSKRAKIPAVAARLAQSNERHEKTKDQIEGKLAKAQEKRNQLLLMSTEKTSKVRAAKERKATAEQDYSQKVGTKLEAGLNRAQANRETQLSEVAERVSRHNRKVENLASTKVEKEAKRLQARKDALEQKLTRAEMRRNAHLEDLRKRAKAAQDALTKAAASEAMLAKED